MHLNLARKWRSKHFDEVVGQPLVVRLVKNSLYRNLIFPVYLLSGTRGCGKTSVARIFAAALNCEALEHFQKNPQEQQLPCLTCASCLAMQATKHPDFIEIDAASHTGVDNVRAIIDAAAFVPVLGKKKIYLIDEAHMLSKAAFNAFLKILEEPPISVVFMLATTDPHKILETVTSRCFQLFFDPIEQQAVGEHLAAICAKEEVAFEAEALTLIAQETEGSMRDALNLVERVRIAYPSITRDAVIELLGKIDDERLCELLSIVLQGSPQEVLAVIRRLQLEKYNPYLVWKSFVELIRRALWIKTGVACDSKLLGSLKELTASCSLEELIRLFEICYDYELSFAKTATPAHMLEMMLLKMAQKSSESVSVKPQGKGNADSLEKINVNKLNVSRPSLNNIKSDQASSNNLGIQKGQSNEPHVSKSGIESGASQPSLSPQTNTPASNELESQEQGNSELQQQSTPAQNENTQWVQCLQEIEKLNDPLVVSIFRQGLISTHNEQAKSLEIIFSQDLLFFKEWLENTQKIWQPTIARFFGEGTLLIPHFTGAAKERTVRIGQPTAASLGQVYENTDKQATAQSTSNGTSTEQSTSEQSATGQTAIKKELPANNRQQGQTFQRKTNSSYAQKDRSERAAKERVVTITDPEKWQKAHALLQLFPGTLVVSQENPDGEGA